MLNCGGHTKDAEWIFKVHKEFIIEQLGDRPKSEFVGCIQDNTKANRSAMAMLRQEFPLAIVIGCGAHTLDLVIKVRHSTFYVPPFCVLLAAVWLIHVNIIFRICEIKLTALTLHTFEPAAPGQRHAVQAAG